MDITFKYTPTGLRQSVGYLVPKDPEFPPNSATDWGPGVQILEPNGDISDSIATVLGTSSGHCQRPVYRPGLA